MSMAFVRRGWMLLLTTPKAVLLSVWIGVLGCLWPISLSSWCIGIASRALMYSAPSSALAALDMTAFRIFGDVENCAVVWWVFGIAGAEKVSANVAACVGFAEVGCITVYG